MNSKQQLIALYTLVRRECVRMMRIASQVFLPPVVTTLLYFLIFGSVIGSRLGAVQGVNYTLFIAPGLIMMSVINNTYSHVCSSLYTIRFQKSIEEMLVSPIYSWVLLLSFVLSGMIRGLVVACLVFIVSSFFVDISFSVLPMTLVVILLVGALFSLIGFVNGMLAKTFDQVALVPTFILTPMTYLGGVFYTSSMLSPFWQKVMYFNPIFYMVNALRHVIIGQQEINMSLALTIIILLIILSASLTLFLLKSGIGIRQ